MYIFIYELLFPFIYIKGKSSSADISAVFFQFSWNWLPC